MNPIQSLDVSDTSLIVFAFVTEDFGNLWTQWGSYSTSALYGDTPLVDTTCPTSEEDYWSKAGALTWFNNTSTIPTGVSEFRNNETIWDSVLVSAFTTCTGVTWTNSLPATNWENNPALLLDVSTPSYSASSYSGAVSGLYRTYFSAHDSWYNAQVAFDAWDSERAYSARDNQPIFEGAQADYEAC